MIFTPSPVIDSTPTISEAHRMIAAMVPIWRPEEIAASASRAAPRRASKRRSAPKGSRAAAARMARQAAYCGVQPIQNIPHISSAKGIRKKPEVIAVSRRDGRASSGRAPRRWRRA